MSDTLNTAILLAVAGGGAFLLYKTMAYNPNVYDPNLKWSLAMKNGKDVAGAAHYWANRVKDPNYRKNERMKFDSGMQAWATTHQNVDYDKEFIRSVPSYMRNYQH